MLANLKCLIGTSALLQTNLTAIKFVKTKMTTMEKLKATVQDICSDPRFKITYENSALIFPQSQRHNIPKADNSFFISLVKLLLYPPSSPLTSTCKLYVSNSFFSKYGR
jgi:hypothetical protein